MKKGATILIGEDDCEVRGYLDMAVRCMGYEVILAQDGDEVLSFLESKNDIGAVLLDICMPRRDGLETLRDIRKTNFSLPVIMVSDASSPPNVIQSIKLGATDFLAKPVAHQQLRDVIARVIGNSHEAGAQEELPSDGGSGKLFYGSSPRLREIKRMLRDIAVSEAPVLIRGETGVGKEMIAREIHSLSARARKPLLKLNCAAVPSELVESELFGYERGAFTGAFQRKAGMFELAHGGTLMLDEIGDMKFGLQAKLLQVLQDQEFQRIGGKETIHVDVHIIAATHQNLEDAIAQKQFREDLYYRLNVICIEIPPLRERSEDIIPLAQFLIEKRSGGVEHAQLTTQLKQALIDYDWPGNIRELENVLRRFLILKDDEAIVQELRSKMARRGAPIRHALPPTLSLIHI